MTRELFPPIYHPVDYWEAECDICNLRDGWRIINVEVNEVISIITFETPTGIYKEFNDMSGRTVRLARIDFTG